MSSPSLDPQRRALGARRFEELVGAHGGVQAMLAFSVMGVSAAPATGYTDEVLACVRSDADDVVSAAEGYRRVVHELCDAWTAQRQEHADDLVERLARAACAADVPSAVLADHQPEQADGYRAIARAVLAELKRAGVIRET